MTVALRRQAVLRLLREEPPAVAEVPPPADAPAADPAARPCTGCGMDRAACAKREAPCCDACAHPVGAAAPPPEKREAPAPAPTDSRRRTFVASDSSVDRYNSTIAATGWELDNFRKNPVILLQHSSYSWPIGKGEARVVGDELLLDVDFFPADVSPEAERALKMLDLGVMGVSVGFNPIESTYNKERESEDRWANLFDPPLDYTRQELLEVSVVTIGANPNAVPVGREGAPAEARAAGPRELAGRSFPIEAVLGVLPELVREAFEDLDNETRAKAARNTGRITTGG